MKVKYIIIALLLILPLGLFYYSRDNSKSSGIYTQYSLGEAPIENVATLAGGIFIGKVLDVLPANLVKRDGPPDETPEPMQEATIDVERWILNTKNFPDRFNIAWLGGEVKVGDLTYASETLVDLKEGERVLMFINETTLLGKYRKIIPFGYWQGIYRFQGQGLIAQDPEGSITKKTTMDEILNLIRKRAGTMAFEKNPVIGSSPTETIESNPTDATSIVQ